MPSIGDMLEVVDLLRVQAIACEELRCVAVRNRNSRCKKCAQACINDAITVGHNELVIDAGTCVNCGCCIAVCPTNALHAIEPTLGDVEARVARTADASLGLAVIACDRKAARREGDPEKYVAVPCLGHLSEQLLLDIAAAGLGDIVLVDGDCATCKYGAASPHIDTTVDEAIKLIEAAGSAAIITRDSSFPPEVLDQVKANQRGKSRRGIMRQTGSYVKTVAGNVANKAIEERMGVPKEPLKLRDRLNAGKSGRLPTIEPCQNYALLDGMLKLSEQGQGRADVREAVLADERSDGPADASKDARDDAQWQGTIDTRHFGDVAIDADACSGCGMCVLFCPTAALKYADYDEPEDPARRYLEFQTADCTQCMLCKDVCLRNCLEVHSEVSLSEVFDFEPKLIEIAKPQSTTSLLDLKNRNRK